MCIDDALHNSFDTLVARFDVGGRGVVAGFYAMVIIVEYGHAQQVLVLYGWTLVMGGRGIICACKLTICSERSNPHRNS